MMDELIQGRANLIRKSFYPCGTRQCGNEAFSFDLGQIDSGSTSALN